MFFMDPTKSCANKIIAPYKWKFKCLFDDRDVSLNAVSKLLGTIENLSVGESVSDHKSKSKYDQMKSENTNSKVTKCHLFQEQSETFRTGSLCLATT